MELQLDKDFKATNRKLLKHESFTFNGGEPHIKVTEYDDCISDITNVINGLTISNRINSFNDLGVLLIAIDAAKNSEWNSIDLVIPYFPGARQDRVMSLGEPFTVKVYADILNNANVKSVTIFDPHSDVTPALINNCRVVSNHKFIKQVMCDLQKDKITLISPDGGALKKVYDLSKYLYSHFQLYSDKKFEIEVIECSKKRDVTTGKLSGFKVYEDDLEGKDCLIVDDICDGGGTFVGLAKELKAKGAGDLYLAVSHGIFSKGFSGLNGYFKQIFTTDSFKGQRANNVTEIKLKDGLLS